MELELRLEGISGLSRPLFLKDRPMKLPATALCLLLLLGTAPVCVRAQTPTTRPNVVLLIADDLGFGELGSYGAPANPTPQIDRLAAQGMRYTSGYVTAPFCAASRAGLLTGRYQTRFGFEFNPIGAQNEDPAIGLPQSEKTIADRLRETGYATALLGKWHLGGTANYHPQRRGFDEFFGFLHEGHSYVPPPGLDATTWLRRKTLPDGSQGRWMSANQRMIWSTHMGHREPDYDANNPILRNSQPVSESQYFTEALTREATDFLRRHREQPFFLCVAYNAVHSPMQALPADMAKFAHIDDIHRRIFLAMLTNLDRSVGQLLNRLDELQLAEQTLVIFLSDNGGPTRELTSSNAPLRGEKGGLYEGGIRVPMLVCWPGKFPAGQVDPRPMSSLDLTATIARAAGISIPATQADGDDLSAESSSTTPPPAERALYWRVGPRAAIRQGDWKLVRNRVIQGEPGPWELYNLAEDVSETQELAASQPEHAARLQRLWEAWNAKQHAPLW